jgi:hypothetical protein
MAAAWAASAGLAPAATDFPPGTTPTVPAPAPIAGTPVLGRSLLSGEAIAAWYASTGIVPAAGLDVGRLAGLFVDEGDAQGVRGDLAFAQSIVETGYFRFGGLVRPRDNNYSGLGACDSCKRGIRFPSPLLGVRAQIQHLYAYADPAADPLKLARPLADARFSRVRPAGKAPLWELMGGGNWATDPAYAGKVLGVWRRMLLFAGLTPPPPAVAPTLIGPLTVAVTPDGGANLAGWHPRREVLMGALTRLGLPASSTPAGTGCLMRWGALRAVVLAEAPGQAQACAPASASARWARLADPRWRTARGLSPGDGLARLRRLYPRAIVHGVSWWLIWGADPGRRGPVPRLRAEVRQGQVRALQVDLSALPPQSG